jgi:hypothetical protein
MTDRPAALRELDRLFAAATIAHEFIGSLYYELVELGAAEPRASRLLRESGRIVLSRMPNLTSELRRLERAWDEQRLLDHLAAERTTVEVQDELARVLPELLRLRARQDEVASEMRELVDRAHGA